MDLGKSVSTSGTNSSGASVYPPSLKTARSQRPSLVFLDLPLKVTHEQAIYSDAIEAIKHVTRIRVASLRSPKLLSDYIHEYTGSQLHLGKGLV